MRSVKNLGRHLIAGACLCAIVLFSSDGAFARPNYRTAATTKYPDLVKKHGKDGKLSCVMCHPSTEKSKKKRNNYGVAFTKALGTIPKGGQKDKEKLSEALDKVAKEKSATDGKTFGDLIKDGDLPGEDKVAN